VGRLGRWYEGRVFALDGDRFAVMFLEVTRRTRVDAQRQAYVDLGDRLRQSVDPIEMAAIAAELIGCTLMATRAGYATIDTHSKLIAIDRDWTAEGLESVSGVHHSDTFGQHYPDLAAGKIVVMNDTRQDVRMRESTAALMQLSVYSLIDVPLIEQGDLVAFFFVNHNAPRVWEQDEVDFVRNIAERTRAEIERKRAERATRVLADSLVEQVATQTKERDRLWQLSDDPFLIADIDGIWIRVNPAWTRILGWRAEELLNKPHTWMAHPDDPPLVLPELAKSSRKVLGQGMETRLRAKDGTYRWFAWTVVNEDDQLYCVARDVTRDRELMSEREALEEALRQSQKMEAVGQLTGGIAHDFNNLLTGITGSLELLGVRAEQGRLGDIERYIGAAQGAAKRAAALTHRLLAFSRRQTLDPKPTDINRLVSGVEDLLSRTVGPEITIETVGAVSLWPVMIDANQLENALLNLCINARDAMPDGGRITIETANKWFDPTSGGTHDVPPGQYVNLSVTDNGTGMSREVVERAFDPFFTTKPLGLGTGLGLSMVYGFVRQSGGQVRIYSELGQGTTMRLYFPRHYGELEAPLREYESSEVPLADQGLTVMVVDDEPVIRMLVVEVLGELGYAVVEAADGASGLKIMESNLRIDLLVSDVGLPGGMNGRQLADAARALRPDLKVLFITGYAENSTIGNGYLEAGMHVLTKPFTMELLSHRVKEILSH
jgi:PAS domain S-box-containing protein